MKVALLFPGYGAQFVGMGKDLYDTYRVVQEYFEEASSCLDINFVKLCFASSDAEISSMANAYTVLFLLESSIAALLKEQGIYPHLVAGYNNGEVAALCAAGCFSLPDGLYLLNKFCSLYQDGIQSGEYDAIQVTGMSLQEAMLVCDRVPPEKGTAHVAIENTQTNCIITGTRDAIAEVSTMVEENHNNVKIVHMAIEVGMHSNLMNSVVDQFVPYLGKVDFKNTAIPFFSSVAGVDTMQGVDLKNFFIRGLHETLHFIQVLEALAHYDCIIIGGHDNQLTKIIEKHYPEKKIVSVIKEEDIEILKKMFSHA